jgi:hypothetical protein
MDGADAGSIIVYTIIYIYGRGGEAERQGRVDVKGRVRGKSAERALTESIA